MAGPDHGIGDRAEQEFLLLGDAAFAEHHGGALLLFLFVENISAEGPSLGHDGCGGDVLKINLVG